MIWLALDTSANICAAAIYDAAADRLMASLSEDIGTGHAERLMPMIVDVLAKANMKLGDLGGVIASLGPGSFTGVRIAVSAANGFAQADKSMALIGVSVLDAIADEWRNVQATQDPFAVIIDARRDQFFVRTYNGNGMPVSTPQLCDLRGAKDLAMGYKTLLGSGAEMVAKQGQNIAMLEARTADIATIARLGIMLHMQNTSDQTGPLTPLYLRGADAKVQQGFALPRARGNAV